MLPLVWHAISTTCNAQSLARACCSSCVAALFISMLSPLSSLTFRASQSATACKQHQLLHRHEHCLKTSGSTRICVDRTIDVISLDTPRSAFKPTSATGTMLLLASDKDTRRDRACEYDSELTESKPNNMTSLFNNTSCLDRSFEAEIQRASAVAMGTSRITSSCNNASLESSCEHCRNIPYSHTMLSCWTLKFKIAPEVSKQMHGSPAEMSGRRLRTRPVCAGGTYCIWTLAVPRYQPDCLEAIRVWWCHLNFAMWAPREKLQ